MTTLLELAQKLDRLDPEKEWKERVALAEDMKALLGDQAEEFDRRYEQLLKKSPRHASPVMAVLQQMGLLQPTVPKEWMEPPASEARSETAPTPEEGRFERVLILPSDPPPIVAPKLAQVIHRAQDMIYSDDDPGVVARSVVEGLTIRNAFCEGGSHDVLDPEDVRIAMTYLLQEALRKGAGEASASATETSTREPTPPAGSVQQQQQPEPEPASSPQTEEERIPQAAALYRAYRTLSFQPQVSAENLAGASTAWTAARDAFESGSAAQAMLQLATAQIDQEIDLERRRPQLYPNQLPGALPVLKDDR